MADQLGALFDTVVPPGPSLMKEPLNRALLVRVAEGKLEWLNQALDLKAFTRSDPTTSIPISLARASTMAPPKFITISMPISLGFLLQAGHYAKEFAHLISFEAHNHL